MIKSAAYLEFEAGFLKEAAEQGCDVEFLEGLIAEADEVHEKWAECLEQAEKASGDPCFRMKLAGDLVSVINYRTINKLGGWGEWDNKLTGFLGDRSKDMGVSNTAGGAIMGGGGGGLLGLILGQLLGNPMLGLLLGSLGGAGLGALYTSGKLHEWLGPKADVVKDVADKIPDSQNFDGEQSGANYGQGAAGAPGAAGAVGAAGAGAAAGAAAIPEGGAEGSDPTKELEAIFGKQEQGYGGPPSPMRPAEGSNPTKELEAIFGNQEYDTPPSPMRPHEWQGPAVPEEISGDSELAAQSGVPMTSPTPQGNQAVGDLGGDPEGMDYRSALDQEMGDRQRAKDYLKIQMEEARRKAWYPDSSTPQDAQLQQELAAEQSQTWNNSIQQPALRNQQQRQQQQASQAQTMQQNQQQGALRQAVLNRAGGTYNPVFKPEIRRAGPAPVTSQPQTQPVTPAMPKTPSFSRPDPAFAKPVMPPANNMALTKQQEWNEKLGAFLQKVAMNALASTSGSSSPGSSGAAMSNSAPSSGSLFPSSSGGNTTYDANPLLPKNAPMTMDSKPLTFGNVTLAPKGSLNTNQIPQMSPVNIMPQMPMTPQKNVF